MWRIKLHLQPDISLGYALWTLTSREMRRQMESPAVRGFRHFGQPTAFVPGCCPARQIARASVAPVLRPATNGRAALPWVEAPAVTPGHDCARPHRVQPRPLVPNGARANADPDARRAGPSIGKVFQHLGRLQWDGASRPIPCPACVSETATEARSWRYPGRAPAGRRSCRWFARCSWAEVSVSFKPMQRLQAFKYPPRPTAGKCARCA